MSIGDILIIVGCLAGGYWLVNSVMGPGIDITRSDPPPEGPATAPGKPDPGAPPSWARPRTSPPSGKSLPTTRNGDWHLLLDVPRTASRSEIEAAYKRQNNKALASRDTHQQEQLKQALAAGLAETSRGDRR